MPKPSKPYVTYGDSCGCGGCGGGSIFGCRFTLSVMSDRFIDIILGSLAKTDTGKVWQATDQLSTVYRGRQIHVEDALKACFINAYTPGVHMTMEATFSRGCPGDTEAEARMEEDDVLLNEPKFRDIHFPVVCKIALYPMGAANYMEHIAAVVNHAIDLGLYERSAHYCTILRGDVQEIFDYFHYVNTYCAEHLNHAVLEATLSVNSPTAE